MLGRRVNSAGGVFGREGIWRSFCMWRNNDSASRPEAGDAAVGRSGVELRAGEATEPAGVDDGRSTVSGASIAGSGVNATSEASGRSLSSGAFEMVDAGYKTVAMITYNNDILILIERRSG